MSSGPSDFADTFQAVFIPKQRPAPVPLPDSVTMASLSTFPPLGQVTQVRNEDVDFIAVLEVPESEGGQPWEVALWHSGEGVDWVEHPLPPSEHDAIPSALQEEDEATTKLSFGDKLSVKSMLNFTVKFRAGPDQDWRWVRDEAGMGDGIVIINDNLDQQDTATELPELIHDFNPDLKWRSQMSQCPGTRLWSVEAPIGAAKGEESAFADVPLGVPWGGSFRWFSVVRLWAPWLAPRHGKGKFELDKDAIMCAFMSPQGRHMVVLAISGLTDVMTIIRSGSSGEVVLHVGTSAPCGALSLM